jgi:hypothetical protein
LFFQCGLLFGCKTFLLLTLFAQQLLLLLKSRKVSRKLLTLTSGLSSGGGLWFVLLDFSSSLDRLRLRSGSRDVLLL